MPAEPDRVAAALVDPALVDVVALLGRATKRPTASWWRRVEASVVGHRAAAELVKGVVDVASANDAGGAWDALATENGDVTRGAIHASTLLLDDPVNELLAIARRAGRARIGSGVAPNPKVAAAAIVALGAAGSERAAAALVALDAEIRHRGLLADIGAAISASASALGLTVADLVDASVTHDAAMLASRIDAHLGDERTWPVSVWRARFIDHPSASAVGRALIWRAGGEGGRAGIWDDGRGALVDGGGAAIDLGKDAELALWHPATASVAERASWVSFVEREHLEQPLKQATREVFDLEPRDRIDARYTARFAGIAVRYRQVLALAKQRGWFDRPAGYWSPQAGGCSYRDYRDGQWRVTWYFDVVGSGYEHATAEVCVTDQLHFARYDAAANVWSVRALGEVPRVLFSEALRDVALFAEVAKLEVHDEWHDHGVVRLRPSWPSTAWVRGAHLEAPGLDGATQRVDAPPTAPASLTAID